MLYSVICTYAQPSDYLEILERPEEDDLMTTLHACTVCMYVDMNSATHMHDVSQDWIYIRCSERAETSAMGASNHRFAMLIVCVYECRDCTEI